MDANQLNWIIKNKRKAEKIRPAKTVSSLPFADVLKKAIRKRPDVQKDIEDGKADTIERVVARLEGTNFKDPQGDMLGRACEIMLYDTFKGRGLGQFSTPREVVAFMLDLAYGKPTDEKSRRQVSSVPANLREW